MGSLVPLLWAELQRLGSASVHLPLLSSQRTAQLHCVLTEDRGNSKILMFEVPITLLCLSYWRGKSMNIQDWLAAPSRYMKTGWHLSFPEGICGLNWTKLGETGSFFKLPNLSSGLMPTASWAPLTSQLINLEQKRLLLHKCHFQERVEVVSHVVRAGSKLPSSRWKLPYLSFLASITAVKRLS